MDINYVFILKKFAELAVLLTSHFPASVATNISHRTTEFMTVSWCLHNKRCSVVTIFTTEVRLTTSFFKDHSNFTTEHVSMCITLEILTSIWEGSCSNMVRIRLF
jgi:hypothetical protein